ncbi:MAG: FtsQ-type POTRA domain-containing protein, partial [Thermoanaerobaculia bacterium]|nr:FtsQ-type POTRA domain-containing protein [Thermoanaerobaculia bacterium]
MTMASSEFLRTRQPRRRRRSSPALALVKLMVRTVVLVAPPTLLASWLISSETFDFNRLSAAGMERVPPEWVRERLRPELGQNLLLLPLERVQDRLEGHPWVSTVAVSKQLPNGLAVVIEERVPVAVLEVEEGLVFVDEAGQRIAMVDEGEDLGGFVRLRAERRGEGGRGRGVGAVPLSMQLREARCLRRAIELHGRLAASAAPMWQWPLDGIEVVGDDDFRVFSQGLSFSVLVRSADGVERAHGLGDLLPQIFERASSVREVESPLAATHGAVGTERARRAAAARRRCGGRRRRGMWAPW